MRGVCGGCETESGKENTLKGLPMLYCHLNKGEVLGKILALDGEFSARNL
jgi:hypothetical protein